MAKKITERSQLVALSLASAPISSGETLTTHAAKKGEAEAECTGDVRRKRSGGEIRRTVLLPGHTAVEGR